MTDFYLQTAFITGRSRLDNIALSPLQKNFIDSLSGHRVRQVTVNFPWTSRTDTWQATGLMRASVNNILEYLQSRSPTFAGRYRQAAISLIESADHTLLLAGSCGLELFNNLQLPASLMSRVSIFAYGPVARRPPACRHRLVQGHRDVISRFWFPETHEQISCGHMDYLTRPELVGLCRRFIHEIYQRDA